MKKPFFFLLIFFAWTAYTLGQGVNFIPEVQGSAGDAGSGGNIHLAWTIGELISGTDETSDIVINQGFHQSDSHFWVTPIEESALEIPIKVYPNPSRDAVWIEFESTIELNIKVFDAQGKILLHKTSQPSTFEKFKIGMGDWPSAVYHLVITDPQNSGVTVFNLQKI